MGPFKNDMFIRYLHNISSDSYTTPKIHNIKWETVQNNKNNPQLCELDEKREVFIDLMVKRFLWLCMYGWLLRAYDYSMNLNVRFLPMHLFKDYFLYIFGSQIEFMFPSIYDAILQ